MKFLFFFFISCLPFLAGAQERDLNFYLQQGASSSPLLKDYSNQVKSSTLDSARVRASQQPQLNANALAQYAPSIGNFGYDQAISNGGNYTATVNASQLLFNHALLHTQLQSVRVRKDSIVNNSSISKRDLKKAITVQYITAYSDLRQLGFQQELFALLLGQEKLLKKLVQAGIFKQSDYLTFLVSRQAQEVTISQINITFHNDLFTLNQLAGIADSSSVLLAEPGIVPRESLLPAQLPGFHKFMIDSLQILNQRSLLSATYRPKLSWFADAGTQTSRPSFLYKTFGTSFGVNFSIPIYDGHQRRIASRQLDLAEQTRREYRNYYGSQFKGQILALQKQVKDIEQLLEKIQNQMKYARMLVDIDQKLLNTGDLRIVDYLLAVNNYRSIQFTQTQQEINRLLLINQLNYWSASY